MAEFTKEQLIEKLERRLAVTTHYPDVEEAQLDAEIFKIALAALTADASMYASEETLICAEQGEFLLRTLNRPAGDAIIPLYRLPLLEGLK
ncbi:hypothetical protein ABL265_003728 [Escherichia coli]|nr:hypothetical protein [Escherichia coli]